MPTYHRGQAPLIGFEGEKDAKKLAAIAVDAAGYGGDMDEELANALLDDMDFDRYGKVKCPKIEQMLPKLMKIVEGERREWNVCDIQEEKRRKNRFMELMNDGI